MENNSLELINLVTRLCTDIYKSIGPGYNEVVYHKALEVELRLNNINYQSEVVTPIMYKGYNIGYGRVDILINYANKGFIVELKALSTFTPDTANIQIINYMKHYSITEGMVINFGQVNKSNYSGLNIKYISKKVNEDSYAVFNFINGQFVEQSATLVIK